MDANNARILLFGATGYTGRITAKVLTESGAAPVLVGRSSPQLREMVQQLSAAAPAGRKPTFEVADATEPDSVRKILHSADDVLVSTVGPFTRLGSAAIEAVIDAGAAYVDSCGEPAFIRKAFETYGPRAERTGARLLPAMGYDYAPGNLAGALLIDRAAAGPKAINIGYFVRGPYAPSSGTVGTVGTIMLEPSYTLHDSEIITERPGAHVRSFTIDDHKRDAISLGGSEHFALRHLDPELRDASVFVGWTGRWSKAASAAGAVTANAMSVPGVGQAVNAVVRTAIGGASDTGPAAHQRVKARSVVIAESTDNHGEIVDRVQVEGPNPYDLTGQMMAWSARMLSRRADKGTGAMGPVSAFGLDAYVGGCMAIGLAEID